LVVVTIPEADFMNQINANTQTTILLCLATLILAILLGILTARRIIRPVERITTASEAIANMALDMKAYMQDVENIFGESLQIRIGINTGSVIAGVIGIKKFIYDLWGDAVNLASRMESHGKPGYIQVTDATYHKLQNKYLLEPRGTIEVKGRGEMMTYWLLGRRG
jgi:adenylate cyclase